MTKFFFLTNCDQTFNGFAQLKNTSAHGHQKAGRGRLWPSLYLEIWHFLFNF